MSLLPRLNFPRGFPRWFLNSKTPKGARRKHAKNPVRELRGSALLFKAKIGYALNSRLRGVRVRAFSTAELASFFKPNNSVTSARTFNARLLIPPGSSGGGVRFCGVRCRIPDTVHTRDS